MVGPFSITIEQRWAELVELLDRFASGMHSRGTPSRTRGRSSRRY